MKYSELEKILMKKGCFKYREGSNHTIWYSPLTGKTFPVGRHRAQEVMKGTLKSIFKDAGIDL